MADGIILTERSTIRDPQEGQTCGAWRRHDSGWEADTEWFRCADCGACVPASLFADSDLATRRCGWCKREAARRVRP